MAGKEELDDLVAKVATLALTEEDRAFKRCLINCWGQDVVYQPPVKLGKPLCILFLLERKEATDESDVEYWVKRLFESLKLQNVWVIDVRTVVRTKKGKTANSKVDERSAKWVVALIEAFKPKLVLYSKIVRASVGAPITNQHGQLAEILHPSRTTNGGGGRGTFVKNVGAAWTSANLSAPAMAWDNVVSTVKTWSDDSSSGWWKIMADKLLASPSGKYETQALFQLLCPSFAEPRKAQTRRNKLAKFRKWALETYPKRLKVVPRSIPVQLEVLP